MTVERGAPNYCQRQRRDWCRDTRHVGHPGARARQFADPHVGTVIDFANAHRRTRELAIYSGLRVKVFRPHRSRY
jgi:hypothetical protein